MPDRLSTFRFGAHEQLVVRSRPSHSRGNTERQRPTPTPKGVSALAIASSFGRARRIGEHSRERSRGIPERHRSGARLATVASPVRGAGLDALEHARHQLQEHQLQEHQLAARQTTTVSRSGRAPGLVSGLPLN